MPVGADQVRQYFGVAGIGFRPGNLMALPILNRASTNCLIAPVRRFSRTAISTTGRSFRGGYRDRARKVLDYTVPQRLTESRFKPCDMPNERQMSGDGMLLR